MWQRRVDRREGSRRMRDGQRRLLRPYTEHLEMRKLQITASQNKHIMIYNQRKFLNIFLVLVFIIYLIMKINVILNSEKAILHGFYNFSHSEVPT